jgi:hypothetical protein
MSMPRAREKQRMPGAAIRAGPPVAQPSWERGRRAKGLSRWRFAPTLSLEGRASHRGPHHRGTQKARRFRAECPLEHLRLAGPTRLDEHQAQLPAEP